ncbi:phosphotransferase [Chloroflexi bacterium TSY]|nr:phosphotransferase [Chloroflexi bacterium TSY]
MNGATLSVGELKGLILQQLTTIAARFKSEATVLDVAPYGAGNVNDTYLVQTDSADKFVLQRINQQVFQHPELIPRNLRIYTNHVRARLKQEVLRTEASTRRWEVPMIIPTLENEDYLLDDDGNFWRALSLIDAANTHPTIIDATHAQESGYALARFHELVSDLDPSHLHDTLVGFHITPRYLENYDRVLYDIPAQSIDADVRYGIGFVEECRAWASILEDAKATGDLTQGVMHGDPKVDNILIDRYSSYAVGIIDLDTVKPGLLQYDIGDCLRSCCNPLGEETDKIDEVYFDVDLCEIILRGYLPVAKQFFSESDYHYLYASIRLIAFELGLRFFTDYLAGNVYFKVEHPKHNLQRALVQFKLSESIEAQRDRIAKIIAQLR